jgi:hypothetical protein
VNTLIVKYRQMSDDSYMPMLWIQLGQRERYLALVDSGATVNVLPYSVGLDLGLDWKTAAEGFEIGGSAAGTTKKVRLQFKIRDFDALELEFRWLEHDRVQLILGHDNFFKYFDVCFSTHNQVMTIKQSSATQAKG